MRQSLQRQAGTCGAETAIHDDRHPAIRVIQADTRLHVIFGADAMLRFEAATACSAWRDRPRTRELRGCRAGVWAVRRPRHGFMVDDLRRDYAVAGIRLVRARAGWRVVNGERTAATRRHRSHRRDRHPPGLAWPSQRPAHGQSHGVNLAGGARQEMRIPRLSLHERARARRYFDGTTGT